MRNPRGMTILELMIVLAIIGAGIFLVRTGFRVLTKADLVEKVTAQIARTAGPLISKKDCARVVDSFLDAVKAALSEQQNIEIRGFGTFKIRQRKTRMARNPRTGDPVEVAARPVPVFKPSKELRAMVADQDARVNP